MLHFGALVTIACVVELHEASVIAVAGPTVNVNTLKMPAKRIFWIICVHLQEDRTSVTGLTDHEARTSRYLAVNRSQIMVRVAEPIAWYPSARIGV